MALGALAITGIILALAGGGIGAYASLRAGKAQEKMAKYNAAVAMREAAAAKEAAAYEEKQQRRQTEKLLSKQRAAYAKAGVQFTGSPLLVMEETAAEAELDALAIRRGGEIAAGRAISQAALDRMRGKQFRRAGRIGAVTSLLGGGATAAFMGTRGGMTQSQLYSPKKVG